VADEAPATPAGELVAANAADAVITLGDLPRDWLSPLAGAEIPVLGVHGNHDDERSLPGTDLHLSRAEAGGWSFCGFEGSPRYREGPHQYTQAEATAMCAGLPGADVLVTHSPPAGVNDDPGDPVHAGFDALRAWVAEHRPRYLLHGHTTPDPRTAAHRVGETEVVWVRGARMLELRR
jgi:Icc-related predicted phosphoesterase